MSATAPSEPFPWSAEKAGAYAREHTRRIEVRGHYLARAGVWLLLACLRSLSRKNAWRLGALIGRLLYRFKVRRSVALTNLDIVFGDAKTPAEKDAIYKACLVNVGRQAVNYLRVPTYDEAFWNENVTMAGEPIVREAFNKGRGVIILSMHYGAWELPGGKFGMSGYPISNIIKDLKNPVTERLLIEARLSMNLGTISHKGSMQRIVEGLGRGEGIIMAVDQGMKLSQGVFVDWFGAPGVDDPFLRPPGQAHGRGRCRRLLPPAGRGPHRGDRDRRDPLGIARGPRGGTARQHPQLHPGVRKADLRRAGGVASGSTSAGNASRTGRTRTGSPFAGVSAAPYQ